MLNPKMEDTFSGVEVDWEEEDVEVSYSVDEGDYELEAQVDKGETTARVTYESLDKEEAYDGKIEFSLTRKGETIVEDSESFYVGVVPAPGGEDVLASAGRNVENSLRCALSGTIELGYGLATNKELSTYREIVGNSYTMKVADNSVTAPNKERATRDMIRENMAELGEGLNPPPMPVESLGRSKLPPTHPRKSQEELKEKVNESEEAKRWRELGEKLAKGETTTKSVERIIERLENSDESITDLEPLTS